MYSFQKKTDELRLNQFRGHKVELSFVEPELTFMYYQFNWKYSDDMESLVLYDETEDDTEYYIPLDDIKEILHLSEDVYHDVVDIVTNDGNIFSICTMEEKPLSPICSKCGKDLSKEYVHNIELDVGYGSRFDGDTYNLKLCDDCLAGIFGLEVEANE